MIRLEQVLKTSLQGVLKTSSRCLEDVFARRLEDVLKTSWRRLEDVWPRRIYWSWSRHLEDVLKTYEYSEYVRLDQDILKTSWRRLLKTKSKDVFKTSSSRRMFAGFRHSTNTFFPFLAWCYSCPIKCSKDFFLNARVQ